MRQLAPGARTGGPLLTSRTVSEPLPLPRFWVKTSDWLVKVAAGCARLPVSGTDCEALPDDPLPPASSLTVSVPLRVFLSSAPIWLSVIVIRQLAWPASALGQLLLWAKSGSVPLSSEIELMWSRPSPLFVSVTVAGVAGPLRGWLITSAGGLSVTRAAVASPLRVINCWPPTASLGTTTVPMWVPRVARGWNATSKLQVVPGSRRAWAQVFLRGSR